MQSAKPDCVPARLIGKEEKEVSPPVDPEVPFRTGLGKLHHAVRQTRVDIAFAVSAVSRAQQNPTKRDWTALKKIYRYLGGTWTRGLLFYGGCDLTVEAWRDADHAARKSRTGYVITVGGTPVDWHSKKQEIVALSTADAEYISMAKVAQAIHFVRDVLEFMTKDVIEKPIIVKADSQAALCIVENPSTVHGRSKHIRVRYHFVRDLVAEKVIKFEWTSSETNAADVFTKSLGRIAFERCVDRIMVSGGDDDNDNQ